MSTLVELKDKFDSVWPLLDERTRRIMAASEAKALGYGGVSLVSRACGLSRKAITKGICEIQEGSTPGEGRIRQPGAGRKPITVTDPQLVNALEELIDEQTRGDPESPLRWICMSTRAIAKQLGRQRHPVSHTKAAQILHELDYSLQSNRKTEEGKDHPDRDAQFRYINAAVKRHLRQGLPVISVDTKKKELIGNYHNAGKQWLPAKQPKKVQGHDFPTPDVPRAYPYGVYDIGRNRGFVNVGTDHDTGAFAVASIRGWWRYEGRRLYAKAASILITADGGGSNGWRLRLWKLQLQTFAMFCYVVGTLFLFLLVTQFALGTESLRKNSAIVLDNIFGLLVALLFMPFSVKLLVFGVVLYHVIHFLHHFFTVRGVLARMRQLPVVLALFADDIIAGVLVNVFLQLMLWIMR